MEIEDLFKIAILMISLLFIMIGFISIMEDMINIEGWLQFMLGIMIAIPFYATKSK
jgi:hypothetical protein